MSTTRSLRVSGCAVWLPALALALASSAAPAETRGYAISMVHTATYAEQGNCPNGGNGSTTEIHVKILMDQGYSRDQAVKMLTGNERKLDFDRRGHLYGQAVDVGDFPTSVPDDHIETVQGAGTGHYMYGFNLAGQVTPDSFEDPETHEMVQNQMWRVFGCFTAYQYKSPAIPPYNEGIAWDTAMDSMPAWLLSISGEDLQQGRGCDGYLRSLTRHSDAQPTRRSARRLLLHDRSGSAQSQRLQGAHQGSRAHDRARQFLHAGRVAVLRAAALYRCAPAAEDGRRRQSRRHHRRLSALARLLPLTCRFAARKTARSTSPASTTR